MRFEGKMVYFNEYEQRASGLPSPMPLAAVDIFAVRTQLAGRVMELEERFITSADSSPNAQRASILPSIERARAELRLIDAMAGELTTRAAELHLGEQPN